MTVILLQHSSSIFNIRCDCLFSNNQKSHEYFKALLRCENGVYFKLQIVDICNSCLAPDNRKQNR